MIKGGCPWKIIALVIIACSGCICEATAQKVMGKEVVLRPREYQWPTGAIAPEDARRLPRSQSNLWVVFSDRDDNPTYTTAGGSEQMIKLSMMQPAYVIEEQGDHLHIVQFEIGRVFKSKTSLTINRPLEDYGWIHKKKLLLWEDALCTEERYSIKGLAVNTATTMAEVKRQVQQIKDKKLNLCNDPDLRSPNTKDFRVFDFLFILKEEGSAYLVAKLHSLKTVKRNPESSVLGWVRKDAIKLWKQRLCLEPNVSSKAVKERQEKGIKTSVYLNRDDCRKFNISCREGRAENIIWSRSLTKRPPANWRRMPILSDDIDNIDESAIKTGVVTNIYNKQGEEVIGIDDYQNVESEASRMRQDYRKVNVVFVVDGSEEMAEFQLTIRNVLNQCIRFFDENSSSYKDQSRFGNKFKLGMVVYRDYSEEKCKYKDRLIEKRPLTVDHQEILGFFDEVSISNCNDTDPQQAVYYGINQAVRMFQDKENQSNIIVLLGSGENRTDDPRIDRNALIRNLAKYNVALLGFQVNSYYKDGYKQFPFQIKELMDESIGIVKKRMDEKFPEKQVVAGSLRDYGDGVLKFACPSTSPLPGAIMFPDVNNPLDPKLLQTVIVSLIKESIKVKEDILVQMDGHLRGQGEKPEMNEGMYHFLSSMNVDLELLKQVSYDNVQLFVEGYVTNSCPNLKEPLYSYSVLLTEQELNEIISKMNMLKNPSASPSEKRKLMQDAFKEVLIGMFGKKEAKKMFMRMSLDDLFKKITGMPVRNTILKKINLNDIRQVKIVGDAKFMELESLILNSAAELKLFQADADNEFLSGDQKLYWVPQGYFP